MITDRGSSLLSHIAAGIVRTKVCGVVTLNVQHAAAGRAERQIAWLCGVESADVVVLTEVPADARAHVRALVENGYSTATADEPGDYGVIVATRVGAITPMPFYTGCMPHRLVSVSVDWGNGRTLGVIGLYVPSRGPDRRRNVDKRAFQDDVTTALGNVEAAFGSSPVIVAGDLNVVEPAHQPRYAAFGRWEYDFYAAFSDRGLTDGFRLHQPEAAEYSWYGHSGNGYRFDHLFVTTRHQHILDGCRYLHEPRRAGLSDHSALAARINPPLA